MARRVVIRAALSKINPKHIREWLGCIYEPCCNLHMFDRYLQLENECAGEYERVFRDYINIVSEDVVNQDYDNIRLHTLYILKNCDIPEEVNLVKLVDKVVELYVRYHDVEHLSNIWYISLPTFHRIKEELSEMMSVDHRSSTSKHVEVSVFFLCEAYYIEDIICFA